MDEQVNPLLYNVKLPGKVFQLPSKGVFYGPGILAPTVINGEIQVKAMSALTEMKLRSADLLISGKVVEEVCRECAPEILQPTKLVVKDVDALFCFLVIATYGDLKTVNSIHDCEKATFHDYQISLEAIATNPRNQILDLRDQIFKQILSTGHTLHLKPVTFFDSLRLAFFKQEVMRLESDKKPIPRESFEKMVLDDLLSVIDYVEAPSASGQLIKVAEPALIEQWLRKLTRLQTEEIVKAANAANDWGFNFNVEIKCKDCDTPYRYDLELNPVSFFSG